MNGCSVNACKLTRKSFCCSLVCCPALPRSQCTHFLADPETLEPVTPTEEPETVSPTSSRKLAALCTPVYKDAVVVAAVRFTEVKRSLTQQCRAASGCALTEL
jgi:hypothetical protein